MLAQFEANQYLVRKKALRLFGGAFSILDSSGSLLFYADMKAFKLKEDLRLYTEPEKLREVLRIRARQVLDFSAAYEVFDSLENQKVGVLKRRGWKSTFFRDEWVILDAEEKSLGLIQEESLVKGLVRRFVFNLLPQKFLVTVQETPVGEIRQHFNPFVLKLDVDFSQDIGKKLDRRLGLAAALCLSAIEGRQS